MTFETIAETQIAADENLCLPDIIENVFGELTEKPIWVVSEIVKASNGRSSKIPKDPKTGYNASSTDPKTWATYAQARKFVQEQSQAYPDKKYLPAIALHESLGITAIDLDYVIDSNNQIVSEARDILESFNTYTELSQSSTGIHIFCFGKKAGKRCKKTFNDWDIELYDHGHFVTITGLPYGEQRILKQSQREIDTLYKNLFGETEQKPDTNHKPKSPPLSDTEIIQKAREAKNSAKFKLLFDSGDTTTFQEDESAADFALCSSLSFWTQDPQQIKRIFEQSALYKNKDAPHKKKWDRADYHTVTIEKAIKTQEASYSDKRDTKEESQKLRSVGLGQFLRKEIPVRPCILSPWCREKSATMIHAWRGIGKTFFTLNISYAIASGGRFLDWEATEPKRVLYIDGEMPEIALQERLANIVKHNKHKQPPSDEYFQLLAADGQELGLPYLDTFEGQEAIQPFVDNADVIVFDNLSTLTKGVENEAQAWLPMQQYILQLRRQGKTIIIIHHTGKGGVQRGTSKREDILDNVIKLSRPRDYTTEMGSRFELHFEKTRGLDAKDVTPLDIQFAEHEGTIQWTCSPLTKAVEEKIKELIELGMSHKDIYTELGMSKASFYRIRKKMGI